MRKPFPASLAGGLTAIVLLAAAPASSTPILGDASLICAQTPADAAGDSANPQITPDDPLVGTFECANLCKKWVGTCKGAVAAMKGCWLKATGKLSALRNGTCAVLDGVNEENCKAVVKAERDAAKTFIKDNADIGRDFCENGGLANCLLNCS